MKRNAIIRRTLEQMVEEIEDAVRQRDAVFAKTSDLSLLAEANHQLIEDENKAMEKAIERIGETIFSVNAAGYAYAKAGTDKGEQFVKEISNDR